MQKAYRQRGIKATRRVGLPMTEALAQASKSFGVGFAFGLSFMPLCLVALLPRCHVALLPCYYYSGPSAGKCLCPGTF
jgi:hypothetical protein